MEFAEASAHATGLESAAVATANADAVAGWENGRSEKDRSEKPRGIARVFGGFSLPPGIRRLFGNDEPEPQPEPEIETPPTEEPPEECASDLAFIDGQLVYVDCNANVSTSPGMEQRGSAHFAGTRAFAEGPSRVGAAAPLLFTRARRFHGTDPFTGCLSGS